jgi:hypothetical protein
VDAGDWIGMYLIGEQLRPMEVAAGLGYLVLYDSLTSNTRSAASTRFFCKTHSGKVGLMTSLVLLDEWRTPGPMRSKVRLFQVDFPESEFMLQTGFFPQHTSEALLSIIRKLQSVTDGTP